MQETKRVTVMKKIGKRTAAFILSAILVITMSIPLDAFAASIIGSVKVDGQTYDYDSLSKLVDKVDDLKGKTVRIDMYADWGNNRLIIPEKANVTFNMNGHMYNRGLSSDKSNGEVILVNSDSTLTINGGDTGTKHNAGVYTSTSTGGKNNTVKTFSGGLIAGGYSSNGAGGLDVKGSVNLILNNVTIAGCRAEQSWGSDGYGGAIWLKGSKTNLTLKDSLIAGNYAYNDGGGIYASNKDYNYIYLRNSRIDANYCDDEGGGIALDGEKLSISGNGDSYITGNGAGDDGGGIYLWNDDVSVSSLTVDGNSAGGNGGGIYTLEETVSMGDLDVTGNKAKNGAGLYISNDGNTISGCRIKENTASGSGSGVFVESDVDEKFSVTGTTVIKDNKDTNLYVSSSSRVNFTLTRGSDVHAGFDKPDKVSMVSQGKTGDTIKNTNCIRFLTCDNSGYEFTFNAEPNKRKIYLEKTGTEAEGKAVVKRVAEKVSAENAGSQKKSDYTQTASGKTYDLIRGYYRYPSMESSTDDKDAVFYYSDGYFDSDPDQYNSHLATASWALNMSGGGLHAGGAEDYTNKHAAARQFMADIGCSDQKIYVNDYNTEKPGTDSIGVSIASKELKTSSGDGTGEFLIPIAIRGVGYESEWASNTTLGSGSEYKGEAQGFAEAAEHVMSEVDYYITQFGLTDAVKDGKVRFWISGFSRAGAAANLAAKRLVEKYTDKGNKVFAYPCEAPQGGTDMAQKKDPSAYYCIHNLINYADLVPLVGPTQMGFKRYGVDHYIPGTEAGTVTESVDNITRAGSTGITKVTTYKDNEPLYTKIGDRDDGNNDNPAYKTKREQLEKQMEMVDSNVVFDDYFHIGAINFIPGVDIYEKGSYHWKEEQYIRDFINFFQESSIKSRSVWAEDTVKIGTTEYGTIQQAARDTMALLFSMSKDQSAGFTERASTIMNAISIVALTETDMVNVWDDVIGDWHTLTAAKKQKYITFLWDKLKGTGAFDFLSDQDKANLEKNWPVLADMIFNYVDGDYATSSVYDTSRTMTYSGTLAINMSRILQMHNPEVNASWARVYDSYYDQETEEYEISAPSSVDKPSATINGKPLAEVSSQESGSQDEQAFPGQQTMMLDVGNIGGEAIYYTLEDETNHITEKEKLYRGGISLPIRNIESESNTDYKVTAYAMSRGVKSEKVTYKAQVYSNKHKVTIESREPDGDSGKDVTASYLYEAGDKAFAVANIPQKEFFIEWTVTDNKNRDVTDMIFGTDEEGQKARTSAAASFTMPTAGEDGFDDNYTLTFKANYGDKIDTIRIAMHMGEVEASMPLPSDGDMIADWSSTEDPDPDKSMKIKDITWTYKTNDGEKTVLCPMDEAGQHWAYNSTVYTAQFRIPQTEDRLFSPDIELKEFSTGDGRQVIDNFDSYRDPVDGSLIVTLVFKMTSDMGSAADSQPDPASLKKLTINPFDLNLEDTVEGMEDVEYYVEGGSSVRIAAPVAEGEVLYSWDMLGSGVQADEADLTKNSLIVTVPNADSTIRAQYAPVITKIDVQSEEPVANEPMASNVDSMKISVINTYEIDKDNINFTWTPRPTGSSRAADFSTAYTMACSMNKIDGGINVTRIEVDEETGEERETGEEKPVKGEFVFSDDLEVTVNGQPALFDTTEKVLYYTFEETEVQSSNLRRVKQPDDIFNVEYGSSARAIKKLLPETVEIIVADRSIDEAEVKWESISQDLDDGEETDESVWTAKGEVQLPEFVENPKDVSTDVELKVHVNGADYADSPQASVDSGEYPADRVVFLDTMTDGGDIYYTSGKVSLDDEGMETSDIDDPAVSGKKYEDEAIIVPVSELGENESYVIRAITKKEGMRTSIESYYEYKRTDKIAPPKGEQLVFNTKAQIGVYADDFYTLTAAKGSGVTIDKNGNATATKAGTYKVTAKIKDGYRWIIDKETDPASDEQITPDENTTTEDQTIEFTIGKANITGATVKAKNAVYTGKKVTPKLTVKAGSMTITAANYTAVVTGKKVGTAKVKVKGKGSCTGVSKTATFRILPKKAVIKKVKAGKKKMTVTLKTKVAKTGGKKYQIQYRIKGKKKWKAVTITGTKKVIKKLKKGKKYQIRARAFSKISGKAYYGKWSKVKVSGKIK